jgi:16S rRNA (cytidine1402-2'-O)-methyltransferase
MLQALMSSGFNGQSFNFHGYLPIDKVERAKRIKELEALSQKYRQTQLFMETPFRNNHLLDDVLKNCHTSTQLCIACNINGEEEYIKTQAVGMWRGEKIDLHKKPTVFLLFKPL